MGEMIKIWQRVDQCWSFDALFLLYSGALCMKFSLKEISLRKTRQGLRRDVGGRQGQRQSLSRVQGAAWSGDTGLRAASHKGGCAWPAPPGDREGPTVQRDASTPGRSYCWEHAKARLNTPDNGGGGIMWLSLIWGIVLVWLFQDKSKKKLCIQITFEASYNCFWHLFNETKSLQLLFPYNNFLRIKIHDEFTSHSSIQIQKLEFH